jgi:hypothetical protein
MSLATERSAKARAATIGRPVKPKVVEAIEVEEFKPNEMTVDVAGPKYSEEHIGDFCIIVEPNKGGARVIVTELGLHRVEWQGDAFDGVEKARKWIDERD